jgi:hypothetical protein
MKVDKAVISEICKVGLGIVLGYATLKCITYAGSKQSENQQTITKKCSEDSKKQ